MEYLIAVVAVGVLVWLMIPSGKSDKTEGTSGNQQTGNVVGMMGGSVEDGFVTQHGLDRAGKNPDTRDRTTAAAMQRAMRGQ